LAISRGRRGRARREPLDGSGETGGGGLYMGTPPFPPRCQARPFITARRLAIPGDGLSRPGRCQEAASTAGSKSDHLVGAGELEASWPQEVTTSSAGWFATGWVWWHSCSSFVPAAPPRHLVPRTGLRPLPPHRRGRRLRRLGTIRSSLWPPPLRRCPRLHSLHGLRPRRLAPPYPGPRLAGHRRPLHYPARER
jgi:hypothetical protein